MPELLAYPRVLFDFGAIGSIGGELAGLGVGRPLLLSDRGLVEHGVVKRVLDALPAGIEPTVFDGIPPNPTVAGVEAAADAYREHGCDGVLAIGGGSVMDSGKAVRVAVTHEGPILDYLRDPGRITADVAPLVTVPTTAGTGAELTMGGGIHPDATTRALGLRSAHIKPDLAICDPELALTLPPSLTAATGMDAFGHCLEAYLAKKDDPPGAAIALDGIRRVVRHVERAYADGTDREARWHMQMAALQGGMAIYRGLGPVHALANTFGDADLHHGMLVTVSAPAVVRFYEGPAGFRAGGHRRRHGPARQARCRPGHRGTERPPRTSRLPPGDGLRQVRSRRHERRRRGEPLQPRGTGGADSGRVPADHCGRARSGLGAGLRRKVGPAGIGHVGPDQQDQRAGHAGRRSE